MADGNASAGAGARALSARGTTLLVAMLAIAASARGLFNDFVYDDVPLIRDNLRVHDLAHVREIFGHAYWPPPFVEQLYRPLTVLLLAAQYTLGGGSPLVFRLVSYVLYAAAAALVYRLATRVLSPWTALGVAALFAVHPVHVEAVALGVNQAELIVGLVAVVMTIVYIDRRRAGAMRLRDWLLLAALYGAATLVKESAFILPLLLVAAELTILRTGDAPTRTGDAPTQRRNGVAGFGLLAAVAAASLVLRYAVAGTPAFTVVAAADLRSVGIAGRMLLMLHVVPRWLRLLVWPHHLQVDYAPGEIASAGAIEVVFGVVIVCALVAGILFGLRRSPVLAFGLLWLVTALLPVSNVVPTGVVLAERTLFLASIGFLLAVGAVGERVVADRRLPGKPVRLVLALGCALLVLLGLLRSIGRQAVWNTQHLTIVPHGPIARNERPVGAPATRSGRGM